MGKRAFSRPVEASAPIEHPLFESEGEPPRPRCKGCDTPLVCAESVRKGICRICKPHKGKRSKIGKRADWRKKG